MDTVNLGRHGLKVSRLCLGTMVFGAQCDEPASIAVMDAAAELGFNFFDVAEGDRRTVAQGPAWRIRDRDQVQRPDGTGS